FYGKAYERLKLLGGFTLIDTELRDKRVIGVPEIQVNAGLEWRVKGLKNWFINSHVMYSSDQYADFANRQRVPSWSRVDLGARYVHQLNDLQQLHFRFNIENLRDRNYWASVGGFPGEGYLTLSEPRNIISSLTYT